MINNVPDYNANSVTPYNTNTNYYELIRELTEDCGGLQCCVDLMDAVVTYLKVIPYKDYKPRDRQMLELGGIIVSLVNLSACTHTPFESSIVDKSDLHAKHSIGKKGKLSYAATLMHWANRFTLSVNGGANDEKWIKDEISNTLVPITTIISALAEDISSTFHECAYHAYRRIKMTREVIAEAVEMGKPIHERLGKRKPVSDDPIRDSRVIDRNNPLCEVKVHEELTKSPRDAMGEYVSIQVGAFNVINRNGHVYKISEKDLVDKVKLLHGKEIGELSQSTVVGEMNQAEDMMGRLNRISTVVRENSYGVLTDSSIVRQTNGLNTWLTVLGTIRLNADNADAFKALGGKEPEFAIRAITQDSVKDGITTKAFVDLIAFDMVPESAVYKEHRYQKNLFSQEHDLVPSGLPRVESNTPPKFKFNGIADISAPKKDK